MDAGDWPSGGKDGSGDAAEGVAIAWGQLDIAQVLAAATRHQLHEAGMELPGWDEWRDPFDRLDPDAPGAAPGAGTAHPVAGGAGAYDQVGEAEADSAQAGDERIIPAGSLGGHVLVAPGPQLAGWLASIRCRQLDDAALVTSITGWRKLTSWAQAQELAAVAELARRRGVRIDGAEDLGPADTAGGPGADADGQPVTGDGSVRGTERASDPRHELEAEFAPQEVALALTLTRNGAEYWTDLAVSLAGRLPGTLAALGQGKIDLSRARLIEQYTAQLSPGLARHVEEKILGKAERQTTGQLRAAIQRAVLAVDPAAAERRRQEAEQNARVEVYGDGESTAAIGGRFLPAAQTAAAWARICAMAKAMESAGAGGGADLLRAQVFMGLLLGTLPLIPPAQECPEDSQPAAPESVPPAGSADPPDGGPPEDNGPPDDDDPAGGPRGGGPRDGGPREGGPREGGPPAGRPLGRDPGPPAGSPLGGRPRGGGSPLAGHLPGSGAPPEWSPDPPSAWPPIPPPGHTPAPGCAGAAPGPSSRDGPGPGPASRNRAPPDGAVRRGGVALLIPWRTLAGVASEPGQVSRIGPVTAEVARALATVAVDEAGCEWRLIITGPAGNALAATTIRTSWLEPARRRGSQGVVARVVLTLPLAALDEAKAAGQAPSGEAWPPALHRVLAAALRAASRAAERAHSAAGLAADRTLRGGACQHEDAVPGYRVPDSMRALLEARDRTCRHPGCRCPARRCDQDHTIPFEQGGPTCPCNLSSECRHHHRLKQLGSWLLSQPRPGVLTWRTPAGLAYTVTPEPYGT